MKKIFALMIFVLAVCTLTTAQTMNIQVGQVTYQFPAEQTGQMNYRESCVGIALESWQVKIDLI